MNRTHKLLNAFCIVIALTFSFPARAFEPPKAKALTAAVSTRLQTGGLWQDHGKIASLNLIYGPGGKKHKPAGKFTFVKENMNGTSPKFDVLDEQGVRWRVKLGEETKSETAATRLVWAAGYYTDEDYYLHELRVEKMPKLKRGDQYVSPDGVVRGVRLERKLKGEKKIENWSWFKNPYVGTKELNGLRIMMALTNNWDLKEINNAIYQEKGGEPRYVVSDLGATFGRTGNPLVRSKSNLENYRGTKFIQKATPEHVDFFLSSRPLLPTVVDLPNYVRRTKMQEVAKHIPRAHAKWLGKLLGQLSAEQIRDCFRAAGYSPEEVEGFAKVVQGRIAELNRL
jgi:hypothetical protein